MISIKWTFLLLAVCCWIRFGDSYTVQVGGLHHTTDDRFMSYTLDTTSVRNHWVTENMTSARFLSLSKPLAPAFFRVGGTSEDKIIFQENPDDELPGNIPDDYPYFILSGQDFQNINEYAIKAGVSLVYGLNAQVRKGSNWNPLQSEFDTSNVKKIIQFANDHGYNVVWQLGNEPDLYSGNYKSSGAQVAQDFIVLRTLLDEFPHYPLLIGPDVAGAGDFLQNFVNDAKWHINAVTWHQYYGNGATMQLQDFATASVLNRLSGTIDTVQNIMKTADSKLDIWLSETSSAYGSGAKSISDRFVAGFAWLDKLGMAAMRQVAIVCRQDIVGGNYALLSANLDPNPDWWLSVLFKRLVGTGVLEVPIPTGDTRVYAHCASYRAEQPKGAVVLYGSNLADSETHLDVSSLVSTNGPTKVLAYVLTGETGLDSKTVLLNGNKLELGSDASLPDLNPEETDSDNISMPPQSLAFYVFPDLAHDDC